jgi:tripartite ATP-independent transporter DctP family solute receptor
MQWVGVRVALFALVLASLAASARAREFRFEDNQPAEAPTVQAVAHIHELLKERTKGRLGIKVSPGDKDSETLTIGQIRTGLLDMARVNLSGFHTLVPSTVVPSLPFLFGSTSHMRRVLDGPIGQQILASMEAEGVIGLCFYDLGSRSLYSARKPIRQVDDMNGLSVRVQPSDIWIEMVKAMGAKPVALPFDRVAAAMRAGAVDIAENNWPTYVASGHHQTARYYNLTEHSMTPGVLVFSKKVWSELSPTDRRLMREAARDSVFHMRTRLDAYEVTARVKAEASGVQVIDGIDRKSFADVLIPLYPRLLPNPGLQGMVQDIRKDLEIASQP